MKRGIFSKERDLFIDQRFHILRNNTFDNPHGDSLLF